MENLIERAIIIHQGRPLRFDLSPPLSPEGASETTTTDTATLATLDQVEAQHIRRALTLAKGKVHGPGGAGERLGINPNTLRHRMRKHGIPFKRDKR